MREGIRLICCAAGRRLASTAAERPDGRFAPDRDAGRERAGERRRKPGGARPKSGAAAASSRVYWRSDLSRLKSRAELAPH